MRKETRFLIFSYLSFLFVLLLLVVIFPAFATLFIKVGTFTFNIFKGLSSIFFGLIGFSAVFFSIVAVIYAIIYFINRIKKKKGQDTKEGRDSLFRSIDLLKTKTNSFSGSSLSRPKAEKLSNKEKDQGRN